jgi:hypothetical protein
MFLFQSFRNDFFFQRYFTSFPFAWSHVREGNCSNAMRGDGIDEFVVLFFFFLFLLSALQRWTYGVLKYRTVDYTHVELLNQKIRINVSFVSLNIAFLANAHTWNHFGC